MWEFDHLVENAVKYKLWPEQKAGAANGLPVCTDGTSYLTTSMINACFNVGWGARKAGLLVVLGSTVLLCACKLLMPWQPAGSAGSAVGTMLERPSSSNSALAA